VCCSILITALSYTATNLLYDFEGSPPVHADDEDSPSTDLPLTNQTSDTYNQGKDPAPIPESDTPGFYMDVDKTPTDKCWRKDDSAQLPRPSNVGKDTGGKSTQLDHLQTYVCSQGSGFVILGSQQLFKFFGLGPVCKSQHLDLQWTSSNALPVPCNILRPIRMR
jgi:hypothetical protein